MTQTTSHALEDKYNAEEDAKKIAQHEAEKEPTKTNVSINASWLLIPKTESLRISKRTQINLSNYLLASDNGHFQDVNSRPSWYIRRIENLQLAMLKEIATFKT